MIARTPTIAQARLREVLNYDPGSGVFTARYTRRGSRAKAGDQIGTFSPKDDCLLVSIDGRTYPLHNLAWLWVHGELPAKQLIKLDGNGRNVRISNLALSGAGIDLTQVRLKNFLAYDAETGIFRWKIRPAKNVQLGSIAGSLKLTRAADLTGAPNKFKHRVIRIEGVEYQASRLAWMYVHGAFPDRPLRYLDGNSDNLAFANLALPEHDARTQEGVLAYQRSWKRSTYGAYREKDLRRDFGMPLDVYQQLFVQQKGVCAICERPETATRAGRVKWLAVDHSHESGAVRGLLCHACNTSIGHMGDDPERLERAAAYLRKAKADLTANVVQFIKKGPA